MEHHDKTKVCACIGNTYFGVSHFFFLEEVTDVPYLTNIKPNYIMYDFNVEDILKWT